MGIIGKHACIEFNVSAVVTGVRPVHLYFTNGIWNLFFHEEGACSVTDPSFLISLSRISGVLLNTHSAAHLHRRLYIGDDTAGAVSSANRIARVGENYDPFGHSFPWFLKRSFRMSLTSRLSSRPRQNRRNAPIHYQQPSHPSSGGLLPTISCRP